MSDTTVRKSVKIGDESPSKDLDAASKTSIVSAFADEWDEENLEEVEVAAQITMPTDGGWGWVVVATSFFIGFANDGITFTFGSLLSSIAKDLCIKESLAALINSVTVASYYCCGPVVSALINRFGFRLCAMTGATIASFSCLFTTLFGSFTTFIIFYGVISGFGCAMSNMSAFIIVGFYFQKWRSIAFTMAVTGCSVGITFFNILNSYLSRAAGWKTAILAQSTILAITYFLAMTYRPLVSMSVVQTTEEEEDTTSLDRIPSLTKTRGNHVKSYARIPTTGHNREPGKGNPSHRLFNAVSNMNFPTAATIIEDANEADISAVSLNAAGPSTTFNKSRVTLVPHNAINENELKKVKSMIAQSQANINKKVSYKAKLEDSNSQKEMVDIVISVPEEKILKHKRDFWKSLFHWEKHDNESRPMYRDDAFYEKNYKTAPESGQDDGEEDLIEYQLKVSRAAATSDLKERRGIFTTAFRRVLATMLDPVLMKRKSFLFICFSMFMIYVGFLIPVVFVAHRGRALDIDKSYCDQFISVIGFSGIIGRFVQGFIALKIHPISIMLSIYSIAGIGTIISGFGKTATIQFVYCFVYGFTTSSSSSLRSMALVKLYGIENLTNGTGIVVLFQGLGCLISTPVGGILKDLYGYQAAFIFSGTCLTIGALLFLPVIPLVKREENEVARSSIKMPRTRSVIIKSKGQ